MDGSSTSSSNASGSSHSSALKKVSVAAIQKQKLEEFLGRPPSEDLGSMSTVPCVWKIIIFDAACQNMLSTLLKVGNLRDLNITLHMSITSKREKLHGMHAIYLIEPTKDNITLIAEDFKRDLYDDVELHFSSTLRAELLDELAVTVGTMNAVHKIKRVIQHDLAFVTLSRDLFTLNIPDTYKRLRDSTSTLNSSQIESVISSSARGLYNVLRTLKRCPVIFYRSRTNSHNERLAREVSGIFEREYLTSREYQDESDRGNIRECMLILVERDSDLSSVLLHPWHYGALVEDVFGVTNNKVTVPNEKGTSDILDLECSGEDAYWADKICEPYPDVAENINALLDTWNVEFNRMMTENEGAAQMAAAVGKINVMKDRKRLIEVHMAISKGIMEQLKQRSLDRLFEIGQAIVRDRALRSQERKDLMEIFTKEASIAATTSEIETDRTRLLVLILLFAENVDAKEFAKLFEAAAVNDKVNLEYIDRVKSACPRMKASANNNNNNNNNNSSNNGSGGNNNSSNNGSASNASGNNSTGGLFGMLATQVKSKGKGLFDEVKNYLPTAGEDCEFENVLSVRNLLETKALGFEKLGFHCVRPGSGDASAESNAIRVRNTNHILVFAIDGGNFNEYTGLVAAAKKLGRNLVYGAAEIVSAKKFIAQAASIQQPVSTTTTTTSTTQNGGAQTNSGNKEQKQPSQNYSQPSQWIQ